MYKIILASGSPRRKEILEHTGAKFEIITSDKEEIRVSTKPWKTVKYLAEMKADDVLERVEGSCILIGADTVVANRGKILGKPSDKEEAVRMLKSISGRAHDVYTGVCIIIRDENGVVKKKVFSVRTRVYVNGINDTEIDSYVASGEPMDKAGAYAIQGGFAQYIKKIRGDYYNVMGLPISSIYEELKKENIIL